MAEEQRTGGRDEAIGRLALMASGDDQWDLSRNDCAAIRQVLALVPPEHTNYVRVSREFVAELKAAPSQPVTIQIEEREHGELEFIATRHDCPSLALHRGATE